MSAPILPKSGAPNRWLSTAVSGSTLFGGDTYRDQLAANTTNVTLVGGALDDTYIAYDTSTKITEQASGGVDTVITYGNGYTLGANIENLTLMGTANSTATGNAGNNLITGNAGNNKIVTGGGNDVLVGSSGADTYVPTKEADSITWITGFKTSGTTLDKIDLRGFGIDGFSGIQSRMSQVGTDVRIDLGNGQQVMLENKTTSELTAASFQVEATAGNIPGLSDLALTFADEFNTLALYSTWKPYDGWGNRTLIGNKELELYVDPQYKGLGLNPFSVDNGILTITAAKADPSLVPQLGGYQYTSGMLSSHASFTQQYGYFEIRAQMTDEQGMWPAFWMLASDGTWPPELDVVEMVGKNPYSVVQSVHTKTGTNSGKTTMSPTNLADGFHTYGMDWTASTITFYFDGQATYQVATPDDMHKPMYMLVNMAVGGTWPGSPDSTTDWSKTNMKVDYIRAYQHTGIPAPTPVPPPVTPPPAPTGFEAVISNATNASDLTDSFTAQVTGNSTSTTYTAAQLDIAGVDPSTSVVVAYDANGGITVTNKGGWNTVKNATVKSDLSGSVTINNFVDAEIALGNGNNTVAVGGTKRGSIVTGSGDDVITVTARGLGTSDNVMTINAGDGNNTINFTGPSNTMTAITTGSGTDTITLSGQAGATVDAGGGNDQITLSGQVSGTINAGDGADRIVSTSTGSVTLTGGAGRDVFELAAGIKATITDFVVGEDSLVLQNVATSTVQVKPEANSTLIDLGNGSTVTLAGIAVPGSALGLPSQPLTAILSNTADASDLTGAFSAPATGANTSTTYTATQLNLAGMDPKASATVSYDADDGLTIANRGIWNGIKNARVESLSSGSVTMNNFVDARVSLGGYGDNTVKITSAKRGAVTTGAGNDRITVTGYSNSTNDNVMTIAAGDGDNTVSFSGASNTKTAIATGSGSDIITISGQASGTVSAGAGNDRIITSTSGSAALAGGAGSDVFEFIRSAHATISDFNASEDSIVIRGGSTSTVQVKAGNGFTMVDLGNGASIMLAGVTTPTSAINIAYA